MNKRSGSVPIDGAPVGVGGWVVCNGVTLFAIVVIRGTLYIIIVLN